MGKGVLDGDVVEVGFGVFVDDGVMVGSGVFVGNLVRVGCIINGVSVIIKSEGGSMSVVSDGTDTGLASWLAPLDTTILVQAIIKTDKENIEAHQ